MDESIAVNFVRPFFTVILEPSSPIYVCPSEEIILNCSVPDTDPPLVWTVPGVTSEEGNTTEIIIFCNTMHPTRRGPYQPSLIGCADGKINSSLAFNVSREVNVTCWTGGSLMERVTVGPHGTYQVYIPAVSMIYNQYRHL